MGNTHTASANTWTRITCGAFSFAGTPVQTQLKAHIRHAWAHTGVSCRAVLSVIDWAHGGDGLTSHISSVPHRQTRQSESRAGGVLAKSISGSALHMLGLDCRCKQLSRTGWITTWWLGVKYSNNVSVWSLRVSFNPSEWFWLFISSCLFLSWNLSVLRSIWKGGGGGIQADTLLRAYLHLNHIKKHGSQEPSNLKDQWQEEQE